MRVLVDTSVWSLALRRSGPANHPQVGRLETLLLGEDDLFLIGLILQEVLQAFRSESTARRVAAYLEPFPLLSLTRSDCLAAARLFRLCRSRGLTVSTADCRIAAAAIEHDCALLTADRDFQRMARHSPLRLA